MEVVKELQIWTGQSDCFLNSENSFHLKIESLSRFLNNSKRPVYVALTKVLIPKLRRSMSMKVYYGPVKKPTPVVTTGADTNNSETSTTANDESSSTANVSTSREPDESTSREPDNSPNPAVSQMNPPVYDMENVSIAFSSYEELCTSLEMAANLMPLSQVCLDSTDGHESHICHQAIDRYHLSLKYENCRFSLTNGNGFACKLSNNCARLMGFLDEDDDSDPLLDGYKHMGEPKYWLESPNKYCNVLVENFLTCATTFKNSSYYPLGTISMEKCEIELKMPQFALARVQNYVSSELTLQFVNEYFEPYVFEPASIVKDIFLVLTFYSPL